MIVIRRGLRLVTQEVLVDVGCCTAASTEDADAFSVAGEIRIPFDGDQAMVAKVFYETHMTTAPAGVDHKDQSRFQKREIRPGSALPANG